MAMASKGLFRREVRDEGKRGPKGSYFSVKICEFCSCPAFFFFDFVLRATQPVALNRLRAPFFKPVPIHLVDHDFFVCYLVDFRNVFT